MKYIYIFCLFVYLFVYFYFFFFIVHLFPISVKCQSLILSFSRFKFVADFLLSELSFYYPSCYLNYCTIPAVINIMPCLISYNHMMFIIFHNFDHTATTCITLFSLDKKRIKTFKTSTFLPLHFSQQFFTKKEKKITWLFIIF